MIFYDLPACHCDGWSYGRQVFYVLRNLKSGLLYVGMTEELEERLKQHNSGKSKFTKGHVPWEIIYYENFPDYESGRTREKYLKTASGKRWLRKKLEGK